ncbi:peptide-methionine (S)-S-oxide reductase [Amylibacter sp. IMCC11727]|uniref:peptide-methionine (S)-S-oxide reductase n=1 Tax=Amylibacter sp. IMCC11727 TaxID=3039851 RepID=UPI00244E1514|nr:peptide-methionine (S)-S-oxide reductase [Amylibacter sp. IMCC11727]WGI20925.1 peptide-methionine (S)-S-oxide reductase [Amylibacter sp. IMCC11727]
MTTHCKIAFGGGCHWCTEAVFQALRGVQRTEQGFVQSTAPNDTWSEAVIVHFDPAAIPLATLVEIHVRTHASTSAHKMRGKYRSAVYTATPDQTEPTGQTLAALAPEFDAPLVTQILPLIAFKPSDSRFHNYYETDPTRPFCKTYIDPKLAKLRTDFTRHLKES